MLVRPFDPVGFSPRCACDLHVCFVLVNVSLVTGGGWCLHLMQGPFPEVGLLACFRTLWRLALGYVL